MPMLLKIVNQNRENFPHMTFGDVANGQHLFEWNEQVGAYCYAPTSAQESDDIIASNWVNLKCAWRVAPVWDGSPGVLRGTEPAPKPSTARIPPYVRPELYAGYGREDLLEMGRNDAIVFEGDLTSTENIRRQLHRYYEGRAWAAEEMRRLREQLAAPTADAANSPRFTGAPTVAFAPATPTLKIDRAAKARAVRSAKAAERRAAKEMQPA